MILQMLTVLFLSQVATADDHSWSFQGGTTAQGTQSASASLHTFQGARFVVRCDIDSDVLSLQLVPPAGKAIKSSVTPKIKLNRSPAAPEWVTFPWEFARGAAFVRDDQTTRSVTRFARRLAGEEATFMLIAQLEGNDDSFENYMFFGYRNRAAVQRVLASCSP